MSSITTPSKVIESLKWRYATKAFDASKKIPADVWETLEQSLLLAPSSFGLQPWKFYVINTPAVREKLKAAAWGQTQITDASHLVVLARKATVTEADVDKLLKTSVALRGGSLEALAGYRGMMAGFVNNPAFDTTLWTSKQVYIALGFLLETAAVLGVDACPIEGFDPKAFDEILGLPAEGYHATVVAALGYRSDADKYALAAKVRYPKAEIIKSI